METALIINVETVIAPYKRTSSTFNNTVNIHSQLGILIAVNVSFRKLLKEIPIFNASKVLTVLISGFYQSAHLTIIRYVKLVILFKVVIGNKIKDVRQKFMNTGAGSNGTIKQKLVDVDLYKTTFIFSVILLYDSFLLFILFHFPLHDIKNVYS